MPVSDFERAYAMFKPRKAMVIDTQAGAVRVRIMADGSEPLSWYPSLEQDTPIGDAGVLLQVNSEEYAFIPDNLPLAKTPNIYQLRQRMDQVIDEDIPNAVGPAVASALPDEVTSQLPDVVGDAVADQVSLVAPSIVADEVAATAPGLVASEVTSQVGPITTRVDRVDPGSTGPGPGYTIAQGIMGPVWQQGPVSADWYSDLNDAITAAGVGGIVALSPDVEYVQATPMLALDNLTIQGDSRFGSVIKYTGDSAIQSPDYTTTRVEGLRMFNITLDGDDVGGIGIDARAFSQCHFDMVRIWNPTSHGIWWGGDNYHLGGWSNSFKRGLVRGGVNADAMHFEGRTSPTGAATANNIQVETSTIYSRDSPNSCAVNIVNGEANSFISNDGGYGVGEKAMFRLGSTLAARNRFISNRTENVKRAVLIEGGRNNMFALNSFGLYSNSDYHGAEIFTGSDRNAFLHNWWDAKGLGPRVWEDAGPGAYNTIIDDLEPAFGTTLNNMVVDPRGRMHNVSGQFSVAMAMKVSGEARERLQIYGNGSLSWRNPADGTVGTTMSVDPATKTVEWTANTRFKVPTLSRPPASADLANTICVQNNKLYVCVGDGGGGYVWKEIAFV